MRTALVALSFVVALFVSTVFIACGGGGPAGAVSTGAHSAGGGAVPDTTSMAALPGTGSSAHAAAQAEQALAPMKNPPGDIPDSQQFVAYSSPSGGYSLEVPEGWARTENGHDVRFDFNYDGLWLRISHVPPTSTGASMSADLVKKLESGGGAVTVKSVATIRINGMEALRFTYDSNSESNSVTNKRVRLENNAYYYYRDDRIAELRLWAPLGADNVDQWQRISRSFTWK